MLNFLKYKKMEKQTNYLPIVQAMGQLVQRAKTLKVKREDPYGNRVNHQISDIRIAYLNYEDSTISYINGIASEQKKVKQIPEMLFTIFYQNKKKVIRFDLPVKSNFLFYPEGILSFIWPSLAIAIDQLFDEFYASKSEDNKFHQEDPANPIVMNESDFLLPTVSAIPQSVHNSFLELVKDCYLLERVAKVDAALTSKRKLWIVVDSLGTKILQKQDTFHTSLNLTVVNNQKRVFEKIFSNIYHDWKAFEDKILTLRDDCQNFFFSLERKQLESGIYPLIFAPSAVGTLFHEALAGHMLSGSFILTEKSNIFKGKLGKNIAKNGFMEILNQIQVWDCPRDEGMIASYQYDMEGTEAKNVCLIDHGRVKNFLLDKNSASYLKLSNNGHALAGDFVTQVLYNFMIIPEARIPEPRVSNLKIVSDVDYSLEEMKAGMLEQFGYYFYVESHVGEVDVETGTFNLKVDSLVKISKNGKKEYFYDGVFSANLTDFLSAIQAVSSSYGRTQGYCGSTSGWVPTEEFVPAMVVYGVNWAPLPLPEKNKILKLKRDKYIPKDWEKKSSSFEIWWDLECCMYACGTPFFDLKKKLECISWIRFISFLMMKSFQELARKNLSEKFQGNRMLGSLAMQTVRGFLKIEKKPDTLIGEELLSGYLRFETLFLKTSDQFLKITLFKEKKNLISLINSHFEKIWYSQRISDIRLK